MEVIFVGGYFFEKITLDENNILKSKGSSDGMIIKYNQYGELEWVTSVGGTSMDEITCITATSDEGFIVGGYFESKSITIGEKTLTNANQSTSGYSDGMLIKYNQEGEVEWATSVGGSWSDYIDCVTEASDGGYICRRIF